MVHVPQLHPLPPTTVGKKRLWQQTSCNVRWRRSIIKNHPPYFFLIWILYIISPKIAFYGLWWASLLFCLSVSMIKISTINARIINAYHPSFHLTSEILSMHACPPHIYIAMRTYENELYIYIYPCFDAWQLAGRQSGSFSIFNKLSSSFQS